MITVVETRHPHVNYCFSLTGPEQERWYEVVGHEGLRIETLEVAEHLADFDTLQPVLVPDPDNDGQWLLYEAGKRGRRVSITEVLT